MTAARTDPFWLGDALAAGPDGLALDGVSLRDLATRHGTPLYVYGASTIRRRLDELEAALVSTGAPWRIFFAMKANRFGPVLELLQADGRVGIDACSPREVECALQAGFQAANISVTAGMLSDADLAAFLRHDVHLNLDSRSALRRLAAAGGRRVGLRLNPEVRVGWGQDPKLAYGDSKFGFDLADVVHVAAEAAALGLEVDTLHMHAGWGLQADAAPMLDAVLARLAALAREIPTVRTINVGGGLCWRQRAEDTPLHPSTWASLLRDRLAATGCTIACEPGTFLTASAGVLLARVNTVEPRRTGTWVGIDAGHNTNVYAAHYGIPMAVIAVARPLDPPKMQVHVAGNINEVNDVFARSLSLPPVEEGDLLAMFPAGAYGASMASDHCLRGPPAERLV